MLDLSKVDLQEVDELIQAHVDFEAQANLPPTAQEKAQFNLIARFNLKGYTYNNLTFVQLDKVKHNLFQTENQIKGHENKSERDLSVKVRYATEKELRDVGVYPLAEVNAIEMPSPDHPTKQLYNEMPSLVKMWPKIYQNVEQVYAPTQETPEAVEVVENEIPRFFVRTGKKSNFEKLDDQTLEAVKAEVYKSNICQAKGTKAPQKKVKKQHVCSKCGHSFVAKPKLKRHLKSVHEEKKKPYGCSIRRKASVAKRMSSHFKNVHEKIKPFKCHTFAAKRQLKKHLKSVHEKKKKPLNIRRKGSAAKRNSSSFKSVHEKIKPFKCHACEMGFLAKKNLYRHIATDHERKKITKKP